MKTTKIPVNIYAESTPNPQAMKFVSDLPLLDTDEIIEVQSMDEAIKYSPLATELFRFPFTRMVHITAGYVTILKNDLAEWDDIALQLREVIRDLIAGGIQAKNPNTEISSAKKETLAITPETTDETSQKIIEILEDYVRPAVERDGGSIQFKSFKNGVVKVAMGGACSGCPSTTVTLKNGVEQLLKQMLPDQVKTVDALEI